MSDATTGPEEAVGNHAYAERLKSARLGMDWIDDKPEIFPGKAHARTLSYFFELNLMSTPEEIAARTLAADIHITDLRLSEAKVVTDAALAPAAGLTATVIRALQTREHPAVILPYSAHQEEFGSQWALLQLFRPSGLHVVWDETINKSRDKFALINRAIKEYRTAVQHGTSIGVVDLTIAERERLRGICREAEHGKISGFDILTMATHRGPREILLGSLFYDKLEIIGKYGYVDECYLKARDLEAWLISLPEPSDAIVQAERISGLFWIVAHSKESEALYQNTKAAKHELAWLCGGDWHQIEDVDSWSIVRLALLFLLIRETGFRAAHAKLDDAELADQSEEAAVFDPLKPEADHGGDIAPKKRELLALYRERVEKGLDICTGEDSQVNPKLEELAETLRGIPIASVSGWDLMLPMQDQDVVRLIDPLQQVQKGSLLTSLGNAERYGKAMMGKDNKGRWRLGRPLNVRRLLRGDIASLTSTEKGCICRFALQHIPPDSGWTAEWIEKIRREQ